MQTIAPDASWPTTGHPTSEELAAYIDGNLSQSEAAHVTKHLASCEDCYDIYSMAVRFLLEDEPAPPVDNVVSFPKEKLSRRREPLGGREALGWLAAAAALLVVSSGIGGYLFLTPPPPLTPTEVLASVPSQPETQKLWTGPRHRGGESEELGSDEASFRLGVELVNLQLSLKEKDPDTAGDVIAFILQILPSGVSTSTLEENYKAVKINLLSGKAPTDVLPEVARLANECRDSFDPTSLDLGQWVEAGRLAALAHNPSFFQQSETRAFLRRLRWNDKFGLHDVKLDPTTRQSLDRVSEVLSRSDLRPSAYAELQHELETILEAHYPQI